MAKIMEIIKKETKGKSYHTYKYSYDSIGLPSIDYDDDPNKIIKWKDSGETNFQKKSIHLKPLADKLQEIGEPPLLKYFLDGSRHVFKVDDIAYNKFKDDDYKCNDEEINTVLNYYKISRDDTENN